MRTGMREMALAALNRADQSDPNLTFTVSQLANAIEEHHLSTGVIPFDISRGALSNALDHLWERDMLPPGWVYNRVTQPKHLQRGSARTAQLLRAQEASLKLDDPPKTRRVSAPSNPYSKIKTGDLIANTYRARDMLVSAQGSPCDLDLVEALALSLSLEDIDPAKAAEMKTLVFEVVRQRAERDRLEDGF